MKLILLFNLIYLCQCVRNKDHFQIKLEPDPNREPRLIENESDPDMVKLKNIQDKFFTVVSNTSLAGDFDSFHQILSVVDSEAGLELGRLFFNGILIGMGKENSNQILMEFWEDLQYKLSPDLVEAFKDYKDFAKGMDFKAMPAVLDILFQKDNMGNSLAKMPLGQLVDLVQPEASKYGIDIKAFVNGILGKGDSKFPEMVRKLLQNFNATSLLKAATGSLMKEEDISVKSAKKQVEKKEKVVKESPLTVFKPFIANALKQNGINLDVDAVIQVVSPFLDGGGEMLSQVLQTFSSKDMNLATLAPLLGLLGSQGGKGKQPDLLQLASTFLGAGSNQGNGKQPDLLKLAETFLGSGKNNGGPDIGSMLKMASTLLGGNKQKESLKKPSIADGMDLAGMLKMANTLLGSSTTSEGKLNVDSMSGVLDLISAATGQDAGSNNFLNMASKLLGSIKDSKSPQNQAEEMVMGQDRKKMPERKTDGKTGYKNSNFIKDLTPFLLAIQNNGKTHDDIGKMTKIGSIYFGDKVREAGGVSRLIAQIVSQIEKMGDGAIPLSGIHNALTLSENDWADMFALFEEQSFRDMIKLQSVGPVGSLVRELVQRITQGKFTLPHQARAVLLNLGLNDISIDNFPKKVEETANLISQATSLPQSLSTLFPSLQELLYDLRDWIYESSEGLEKLSQVELNEIVGYTIDMDVSIPILLVRVAAKASGPDIHCLPQALCEASRQMDDDTGVAVFVKKFSSLLYGLYAARSLDKIPFYIEVIRASVLDEECVVTFPNSCPPMEIMSIPYEEEELDSDSAPDSASDSAPDSAPDSVGDHDEL